MMTATEWKRATGLRWRVIRTNGGQVETVRRISLKTALLLQERDRNAGTVATIVAEPTPGGRIPR